MDAVDQTENPYVAVISRKIRNLKKKYDRVVQLDTQFKEGKKTLNEEQLTLVSSKVSLEKALSEIEAIKRQLEEVAEQQEKLKASPAAVAAPAVVSPTEEPPAQAETTDSSTLTQEVELVANSTQYEQETSPVSAESNVDSSEVLRGHLYKLLKLFHVCSRYTSLSEGNVLPADINYFGKCLLGETSIDCFSKTLNQSVRNAELYLDERLGSQYEAIRGMSYLQISEIIDSLAHQLPVPASPLPPRPPTPPPQSPQINFFADESNIRDEANEVHFQDTYNTPIGSFAPSSSPFPLPPSAVMYDQWNPSDTSPTLSPSTLAVSALGGVIAAPATSVPLEQSAPVAVEQSQEEEQSKEPGSKRQRGSGRGRGKPRPARDRGSQNEGEAPSATGETKVQASDSKKGISWGGQQKKAGGALAEVSVPEAPTTASATTSAPKEGGRGSAGRGRGPRGRGAGGAGRGNDSPAAEGVSPAAPQHAEGGRGRGGRGRGRGGPRPEGGRGGGAGRAPSAGKPATAPQGSTAA